MTTVINGVFYDARGRIFINPDRHYKAATYAFRRMWQAKPGSTAKQFWSDLYDGIVGKYTCIIIERNRY